MRNVLNFGTKAGNILLTMFALLFSVSAMAATFTVNGGALPSTVNLGTTIALGMHVPDMVGPNTTMVNGIRVSYNGYNLLLWIQDPAGVWSVQQQGFAAGGVPFNWTQNPNPYNVTFSQVGTYNFLLQASQSYNNQSSPTIDYTRTGNTPSAALTPAGGLQTTLATTSITVTGGGNGGTVGATPAALSWTTAKSGATVVATNGTPATVFVNTPIKVEATATDSTGNLTSLNFDVSTDNGATWTSPNVVSFSGGGAVATATGSSSAIARSTAGLLRFRVSATATQVTTVTDNAGTPLISPTTTSVTTTDGTANVTYSVKAIGTGSNGTSASPATNPTITVGSAQQSDSGWRSLFSGNSETPIAGATRTVYFTGLPTNTPLSVSVGVAGWGGSSGGTGNFAQMKVVSITTNNSIPTGGTSITTTTATSTTPIMWDINVLDTPSNTYSLTVNVAGDGTVTGAQSGLAASASVAVVALANTATSHFDHWSVDSTAGTIAMSTNTAARSDATATLGSSNMTITAHFALNTVSTDAPSLTPPVQYVYLGENVTNIPKATLTWKVPNAEYVDQIFWTQTQLTGTLTPGPLPTSTKNNDTETFGPYTAQSSYKIFLNYIPKR